MQPLCVEGSLAAGRLRSLCTVLKGIQVLPDSSCCAPSQAATRHADVAIHTAVADQCIEQWTKQFCLLYLTIFKHNYVFIKKPT